MCRSSVENSTFISVALTRKTPLFGSDSIDVPFNLPLKYDASVKTWQKAIYNINAKYLFFVTEAHKWQEWNIIYLAATRRVIWLPPEELFGYRQKSYLATARREELSGGRQNSYLATARRVIWWPQKSYEGQSKKTECFLLSPKP